MTEGDIIVMEAVYQVYYVGLSPLQNKNKLPQRRRGP